MSLLLSYILQASTAPGNPLTALIWPSPSSDQYGTGDNRGVKTNTARPETRTQAVIRSDAGALVLVDRRVGDGVKGWSLVSEAPLYCLLLPSVGQSVGGKMPFGGCK